MRILQFSRWIFVFLLLSPVSPAFGDEEQEDEKKPENLKQALAKGKGSVFFRYRYETVTDDAVADKRAHASTLRTVVSYDPSVQGAQLLYRGGERERDRR